MSLFVGIDPGLTGAIAVFDPQSRTAVFYDTPTAVVKSGKKFKHIPDVAAIVLLLKEISSAGDVFVAIEKVNAMPGWKNDPDHPGERVQAAMGVTSAFNFGFGFGVWVGIIAALSLPSQQIHPATWKSKMMAGATKEKDASRIRAMELFPKTANDLKLKRHHGRADALLIAVYASRYVSFASPEVWEETEPTLF